jgi:DNA mismatch repair ATPase MutS
MNAESVLAREEFDRLVARVRALDLRLNLFAGILLNSLVLYDLLCIYRLEKWRHRNRERIKSWLDTIAEADAFNSFAAYAYNHPEFTWPELTEEWRLEGELVGHPLIRKEDCVCNDIRMDGTSSLWIITGANMAGKSTFLRSVGVNVVLALTGSVVCAERFVCPVLEIHSGMRNTDSIVDHQSYFYAELYRLQGIVRRLEEKRPMLILLDEILKGTNSTDKLSGSQALVSRLVKYPCFVLIATHDVALGDMERDHPAIRNYHFESRIEHGELHFDYLLKPGVSTSKNATFLMQKMGIIPS